MTFKILLLSLTLSGVIAALSPACALDAQSYARLKKAGVDNATIAIMVREQAVETAAFTVEEIIAMKTAGIGEATLQALIREGSFLKDREPVVYGSELRSIRLTTVDDLIRIKQAGISDEALQAIVAVSRRSADSDQEQALQRLQEMGIWVEAPQ